MNTNNCFSFALSKQFYELNVRPLHVRQTTHVKRRTPKCGVATVTKDSGTKPATVPAPSQGQKERQCDAKSKTRCRELNWG